MRFLALLILLQSFGNVFAAAPNCNTADELMKINTSKSQFTDICKKIIKEDKQCQGLAPDKIMSCSGKQDNEVFNDKKLGAKAYQCAKGIVWDSMAELGTFVIDMIKLVAGAGKASFLQLVNFFKDPVGTAWNSGAKTLKGGKLAVSFLQSSAMYFKKEFLKNYAKSGNATQALGKTLADNVIKFFQTAFSAIAEALFPQFSCMNGAAKLNLWCKNVGGLLMPPAIVFTWLKYGVTGIKALAKTPKVAKFLAAAKESNLVKGTVKAADATVKGAVRAKDATVKGAITVKDSAVKLRDGTVQAVRDAKSRLTTKPAPAPVAKAPVKPGVRVPSVSTRAPAPIIVKLPPETTSITKMTDDELVAVGRNSQAEHVAEELAMVDDALKSDAFSSLSKTFDDQDIKDLLKEIDSDDPMKALQVLKDYEKEYALVLGKGVRRDPGSASVLTQVIKKQQAKGLQNNAIKTKIDDALSCK